MMSNRLLVLVGSAFALCLVGQAYWTHVSLQQIRDELAAAREDSQAQLSRIPAEVAKLMSDSNGSVEPAGIRQDVSFRTEMEAEQRIRELPASPSIDDLVTVVSEIDGWLVTPGDEAKVDALKAVHLSKLRDLVKVEVNRHLERALKAANGAEGAKALAEAGSVFARYPMSNDRSVVEEATALSARQLEVATRLKALQRMRYNRWALERVEQALNHLNDNVSSWNPLSDNKRLLPPLVAYLGPIDPLLLEPLPLRLYEYVIERLKKKLSDTDAIEFAKGLVAPNTSRKTLGEF